MYQFYYAKPTANQTHAQFRLNVRDFFQISAVRPAMWEEHCLECSAPACFESCVHYKARSDGRCMRFENGLNTFADTQACCKQGVHVVFRPWGNMMTVIFPAMLSETDYQKLWKQNEFLGKALSLIEKSPLPQTLRWQGIRIPEYLRRRSLRRLKGLSNTPDAFIFHGYSYHDQPYRLILEIYDDHASVFKTAIPIQPGENLKIIDQLPSACSFPGNLAKIYPENNLEAALDILWCDFVQGTPIEQNKPAAHIKCMVWDLDNTLWNGILIETDSLDDLQLKPGVLDTIQELDRRGILQSIASKNDESSAMAALKHLGIAEYFLYPQIHWGPKSGSIEKIARQLNIGIDTFAFIDDTPFERQEVSTVWPQVRTYDITQVDHLLQLPELNVPVTAESRMRRTMYQAEEKRTQLMEVQHADITDFLRQCHLHIDLFTPNTEDEKLRCYELVVRTNQLNMTGMKYTSEAFQTVLSRKAHTSFAFSCADDFGSYGIVGFGQYRIEEKQLVFTEFAMSCRVAGKFVESALFSYLLKKENCQQGRFTVQKTPKNVLLRNTLESLGFKIDDTSDRYISYLFRNDLHHQEIVTVSQKD